MDGAAFLQGYVYKVVVLSFVVSDLCAHYTITGDRGGIYVWGTRGVQQVSIYNSVSADIVGWLCRVLLCSLENRFYSASLDGCTLTHSQFVYRLLHTHGVGGGNV